jgi:hypothetical protein
MQLRDVKILLPELTLQSLDMCNESGQCCWLFSLLLAVRRGVGREDGARARVRVWAEYRQRL